MNQSLENKIAELQGLLQQRAVIDERLTDMLGGTKEQARKKRANSVPDNDRAEMVKRLKAGEFVADLAKEFKVSTAYLYMLKREITGVKREYKATPPPPPTEPRVFQYQCDNGHKYKSNLQPGDSKCPTCGTEEVSLVPSPPNEAYSAAHTSFGTKIKTK